MFSGPKRIFTKPFRVGSLTANALFLHSKKNIWRTQWLRGVFKQTLSHQCKTALDTRSAIHAVRSYCKKTGRLPRICDYGRANNLPAITTLYKLFPRQRLTEIYEQYFPEYHRNWSARAHREHTNRIWSQESILKAIDTFYTNTGRFPKAAEFKAKNELPGTSTVYEAFPGEGFQTIFERYFPERTPAERTHKWTPEKILTSICNFYRETGKFPATRDFCSKNHLPSTETVYRNLGCELREVCLQAQRLLQEENSQSENTDSMQDGVADSPKEIDPEEESQGVGLCMGGM